jgi:hypothetical protein
MAAADERDERKVLRTAIIAGAFDAPLSHDEAAAFLGVSSTWLRASDVPRAHVAGGPKYLKSQLVAYVRVRLSSRILEEKSA